MQSEDSDDDIWDYKSIKRFRKPSGTSSQSSKLTRKSRRPKNQRQFLSQQVANKSPERKSARLRRPSGSQKTRHETVGTKEKVLVRGKAASKKTRSKGAGVMSSGQGQGSSLKFVPDKEVDSDDSLPDMKSLTQPSRRQCSTSTTFQKPKPLPRVIGPSSSFRRPLNPPSPCNSESSSDLPDISLTLPSDLSFSKTDSIFESKKEPSDIVPCKPSPSQTPKKRTKRKGRSTRSSARKSKASKRSPSPAASATTPRKTYDGNCPNCQMPFNSPALSGNPSSHVYECLEKPFTAEEGTFFFFFFSFFFFFALFCCGFFVLFLFRPVCLFICLHVEK